MNLNFITKLAASGIALTSVLGLASCATDGKSAYEIAVENGYEGNVTEWLQSLQGKDGENVSISDIWTMAVDKGYEGTYLDFIKEYLEPKSESLLVNYNMYSIVSINCNFKVTTTSGGWPFGNTQTTTSDVRTAGSGVIYDLDKEEGNAYIITNYHVVYYANSQTSDNICDDISVYLYGSETTSQVISAEFVGGSLLEDIAILKVSNNDILKKSNAVEATIGDSDNLYTASTVYTIGNPQGSGIAVTKGVISVPYEYITMTAADEKTTTSFRVIRVDASINGGNSGGGLFDNSGKLIGIVNAKAVDEEIEGMGYALPISRVKVIADKIISNCDGVTRQINKCVLGVTTMTSESYAVYDASTGLSSIEETIKITQVDKNSTAYNKLAIDDVFVSATLNGITYEINRSYSLMDVVLRANAGDELQINVLRNETNITVSLKLMNTVILS